MKKSARAAIPVLVLIVLALMTVSCGALGSQAPETTPLPPEPSPTPPPIPTNIPTPQGGQPTEEAAAQESSTQPAQTLPEATDDEGIIVYGSLKGGSMGLYLLSPSGSYSMPLEVDGVENAVWPDVSPDGTQIAFAAVGASADMPSAGIYVANLDGSDADQLANDGSNPRWSPDGTQIAVTCNGGSDVCVIDAESGSLTNLTEDSTAVDAYPDWTPDGQIVFMSNRSDLEGLASDLFIMNADGSNVRNLTNDPDDDGYPRVSPDGTKIVFTSDRDVEVGTEIYVLEVNTTLVRQVTVDELWNQTPTWGPDSQTILFAAPDGSNGVDLYTIGDRDISSMQLTENPAEDGGLRLGQVWLPQPVALADRSVEADYTVELALPEGSDPQTGRIVFVADDTNCGDCVPSGVYVVDANGDNLEEMPIDGLYPAWSPGFDRIAYVSDGELFIANADGSDETQVTHAFMNLGAIDWDDNGEMIVAECSPYGQLDVCVIDVQQGLVMDITGLLSKTDTDLRRPYWWGDDIVVGTEILNQAGTATGTIGIAGRVAPDGGQIATIIDRQMAITNINGANEDILTSGPATKGFPVWSADGGSVLYTVAPGDGGLYLNASRADGSGAYRVIPDAIAAGPGERPDAIETFYGYNWGN